MAKILNLSTLFIVLLIVAVPAYSQTTSFSYQGRLSEAGMPVTGTRFFRFTLFDEAGVPLPGAPIEQALMVTAGVYNASLDFGPDAFPGPNRRLEVAVKINPGDPYTVLNPRQAILSAPYSIKSKAADVAANSSQNGGIAAANKNTKE